MSKARILSVVGARPNFIKLAPLVSALAGIPEIENLVVHTGQHNTHEMSGAFFDDLNIPRPAHRILALDVGDEQSQLQALINAFQALSADGILVIGDVRSTRLAAVAASLLKLQLVHVEAGLRSFDMSMPEERNRLVVDALSSLLYASEESAVENLLREGHHKDNVVLSGNILIDALFKFLPVALEVSNLRTRMSFDCEADEYVVLTLHRPFNVDNRKRFNLIMERVSLLSQRFHVAYVMHPRAEATWNEWRQQVHPTHRISVTGPLGYLDFIALMARSKGVITDSGGVQEETTALGLPCLTLRPNTERPATISYGKNILFDIENSGLDLEFYFETQRYAAPVKSLPPLWDGRASERIAADLGKRIVAGSFA